MDPLLLNLDVWDIFHIQKTALFSYDRKTPSTLMYCGSNYLSLKHIKTVLLVMILARGLSFCNGEPLKATKKVWISAKAGHVYFFQWVLRRSDMWTKQCEYFHWNAWNKKFNYSLSVLYIFYKSMLPNIHSDYSGKGDTCKKLWSL